MLFLLLVIILLWGNESDQILKKSHFPPSKQKKLIRTEKLPHEEALKLELVKHIACHMNFHTK